MATASPAAGASWLSPVALVSLCAMAPLIGYAGPGIAPIMPLISAEFAGTAHAGVLVRMMMSGLGAMTILGSLVTGLIASRFGTSRLLLVLLGIFAVSGSGIFLLDNLYLIVAARLLQGIAVGGAGVLGLTLLTTRLPVDRRNRWIGFYGVCGALGILLLILTTGAIAGFGWRYAFLLFLLAVPVGLFLGLALREGQGGAPAPSPTPVSRSERGGIPWALMLFGVLCGSIVGSIAMYLPYHLASVGQGTPEKVAMLMVVGSAMGAVPGLAFGWIRARFSAIPTFVTGYTLVSLGLVILVMTRDLPVMFVAMSIHGFGLGVVAPNLMAASAAAAPSELRARMIGFVRAGFFTGPLLAQPGLEAVTTGFGATYALLAIAGISIFTGLATIAFRKVFDPVE